MNPYCRLIPRLNGAEIEENFDSYLDLVKKGVAGFIIFGGKLGTVRRKIGELQDAATTPLIIASDLEQGLGQQIEGGTTFPPAMAVTAAVSGLDKESARSYLQRLYTAFAAEAAYAGINAILAPVLDINSNPKNPIIATRAFGDNPETVSFLGCEMVRILRGNGIIACGKHFPGHGDTEVDSHIALPVIRKDLLSLVRHELIPFRKAVDSGVDMIMLAHLSVPSLDASGVPASLSRPVVSYLRTDMGFKGIVITDAMNMGAIAGFSEEQASLMALQAGVDLILHPSDPDRTAEYLRQSGRAESRLAVHLPLFSDIPSPQFVEHKALSEELTRMAITVEGAALPPISRPFILILDEDRAEKGRHLLRSLYHRYPQIGYRILFPENAIPLHLLPRQGDILVAVFSTVKAWKRGAPQWLEKSLDAVQGRATAFLSFGNPSVFKGLWPDRPRIHAYWDSEAAQEAVAEKLAAVG